MKTPTMLWILITMTAAGHWVEVILPPYLNIYYNYRLNLKWESGWKLPNLPYSVLGLHTEQEGGGEVLQVFNTDNVILRLDEVEVAVEESDEIPNTSKHQPGGKVGPCNIIDRQSVWSLLVTVNTEEIENNPGPGESDGGQEEVCEDSVKTFSSYLSERVPLLFLTLIVVSPDLLVCVYWFSQPAVREIGGRDSDQKPTLLTTLSQSTPPLWSQSSH